MAKSYMSYDDDTFRGSRRKVEIQHVTIYILYIYIYYYIYYICIYMYYMYLVLPFSEGQMWKSVERFSPRGTKGA